MCASYLQALCKRGEKAKCMCFSYTLGQACPPHEKLAVLTCIMQSLQLCNGACKCEQTLPPQTSLLAKCSQDACVQLPAACMHIGISSAEHTAQLIIYVPATAS